MAKAGLATRQNLKPPTSIAPIPPLPSKPATGKTIVFLAETDTPAGALQADVLPKVASTVGWKVKIINFQSANPSTLISGMQTALQYKPVAVIFSALPYAVWQKEVPAYQSAKVALIPISVGPAPVTKVLLPQILGVPQLVTAATAVANWSIVDSKAKGSMLAVNAPAFGVIPPMVNASRETIKTNCPTCTFYQLNVTIPQLNQNQVASLVVTQIQEHPSIKYVLVTSSAFASGLPAAISAAGLSGVRIAGWEYSATQTTALKEGDPGAWIGAPDAFNMWQAVDEALRFSEGARIPSNEAAIPIQLTTKANVQDLVSDSYYAPPFNYQAQYKKLWKV